MIASWAKDEVAAGEIRRYAFGRLERRWCCPRGRPPSLRIPAACGGRAEMEGRLSASSTTIRSRSRESSSRISPKTKDRITAQKVVSLVQDTTEADMTRPEQEVEGAGSWMARPGF